MSRKPYTVKNVRPRRHVNVGGRILSPGNSRTSQMDLDEDELLKGPAARLGEAKRLALVRAPAQVPQAVADIWALPEGTVVLAPQGAQDRSKPAPEPDMKANGTPLDDDLTKLEKNDAEEDGEEGVEEAPSGAPEEGAEEGSEDGGDGDGSGTADSVEADPAPSGDEPAGTDYDPLTDTSRVWTEAELLALVMDEQKTILRSRDLKLSGKEADRVARILEAQD